MGSRSLVLNLLCAIIYAFLLAPIVVVVGASFNAGSFLTFPPQGLSLRWFDTFLHNPVFIDALFKSLALAAEATALSAVIGVAAALYFARHAGRAKPAIRSMILLPLMLPEVLTGIALLFYAHALGLGTRYGIGLLIGHVLITLPFVFLNVVTSLAAYDPALDLAARSLGAGSFTTFRRITLPMIRPGVINGCLFAFIVSFDTFSISFLLKDVGSATLPLQLFDYLRFNFTPEAAAVSTLSIVMTLIVILIAERLVGLDTRHQ